MLTNSKHYYDRTRPQLMRYQQDLWARHRHLIKIKHIKLWDPKTHKHRTYQLTDIMDLITFELKNKL